MSRSIHLSNPPRSCSSRTPVTASSPRCAHCEPLATRPGSLVNEPGNLYTARSRATAGTVSMPDAGSDEGFLRKLAAAVRFSITAVLPSAEVHFLAPAGREADLLGITLGTRSRDSVERATDKGRGKER